jgi:long-chain acyl-CoA synthetase
MTAFQSVAAMLAATVERFGDRLAVVDGPHRRTWAQFDADVRRRAAALSSRGVGRGDGVALVLGNGHEFVTTFLATQQLGAMAVPLNPQFTDAELGQHLAQCDVVGIVTDADAAPAIRVWAKSVPGLWVEDAAEVDTGAGVAVEIGVGGVVDVGPADAALFAFSSGSTGTPKGMIRTSANLTAEAEQFSATVGLTERDVILAVVALFHAHGLGNALLASVRTGATLVLLPRFERDAVLATIGNECVTSFPGVPFLFQTLAETRRAERADLSSLRLCFSAGAPLAPETFDLFHARFGVPIRQLYGCSEAGSVTINLDADPTVSRASVGRPMRGIEVQVVDEEGRARPAGETGEVEFRSPALTTGYVGEHATAANEAFHDGWFRTGDLGHVDETGALYVTGRTKLYISTSGFKVDPFEVEAVLRAHPAVADVVVVGVKGDLGDEVVKAVVVPDPAAGIDRQRLPEELLTVCREGLAPFKVPRIVELRDEIPRSPLGKILRKYLV